ncbi:MAG: proprotein convertase P-domain-containing protein, partial [Planctomycetota bacterium]|nr:proprotein convertase P-domain-containing protein [Planctomycetota bacterium]
TYIGDLIIDLTSPEGTTVRLHDRSGGGDDDILVTYDDDGDGTAPDGPGSLSDFDGELVAGTWTLTLSDNAGADTGSLNAWTLKIASTGETCPPVAYDQSVFTDVDADIDIVLDGASPEGGSLSFTVTSLPSDGTLSHATLGELTSAPVTLPFFSDTVTYDPDAAYLGPDGFTFRVNDGIDSNEAVVSIQVGAVPNPDDCAQAAPIGNGIWDFDTTSATTDGSAHSECQFDGQTYHDIWYSYVACGDGDLLVSTCGDLGGGADYDTDLVVYEGTDCSNLTLLGCNDDDPDNACGGFEGGYESTLSVPVSDGGEYRIRVGGWNDGDLGTGLLVIDGPVGDCDEPCVGDYTDDGVVNVNDLLYVISNWNAPFNVDDLLLVIANWNSNCP